MTVEHIHLSDSFHQRPVNSSLLIATVWIINHIYAGFTNSLTFSLWSRTELGDSIQVELLSEILTAVRDSQLTYVIENRNDVQCSDDGCLLHEDVFLMVDSFESFMSFKIQLVERNFLIAGFYSIIYTGKVQTHYEDVFRIFEELFAVYVTNVNIYVELTGETLMYSYFPFTQYHCHSVIPVVHNRFTVEDGFLYPKPFFPRKTENFYGCVIKVATWRGPPFVFFQRGAGGELVMRGIEGALVNMLSKKMNFTVKIIDSGSRGWVFPNLTGSSGAVKLVIDGDANLTINSFVYSQRPLQAMWASYTYTTYPIIVAVPRGSALNSFQRLMRPFKYIIWSCLSSSVLAGITVIFVIKCLQKKAVSDFVFGPSNSTPFTNLLNIFFGGQIMAVPQRNFARYILLVWLVYTMVLRNAYSGELYIMLQDSTSRTNLHRIEELVERNFTLMCTDITFEVLIRSTQSSQLEIMEGQPYRYLAMLYNSDAKMAVVILRPFLRLYNWIFHGKQPIRTLPYPLVTVPLTMYFRQNSYLRVVIDEHLMDFMAAGLMKIWNTFYLPTEDTMREEVGGEPTVLSVQLLMGLFSVYLFVTGVCVLVFALEMWSRHSPICSSVMNFLNY